MIALGGNPSKLKGGREREPARRSFDQEQADKARRPVVRVEQILDIEANGDRLGAWTFDHIAGAGVKAHPLRQHPARIVEIEVLLARVDDAAAQRQARDEGRIRRSG